jgi:hypothetical protein
VLSLVPFAPRLVEDLQAQVQMQQRRAGAGGHLNRPGVSGDSLA